MSEKYYVDSEGRFLGGFNGYQPPDEPVFGEVVREVLVQQADENGTLLFDEAGAPILVAASVTATEIVGARTPAMVYPAMPQGAREVPTGPAHGLQRWDGAAWVDTPEMETALARHALAESDPAMARGIDDLIAALKAKGVLADADLPAPLRDRLAARSAARAKL